MQGRNQDAAPGVCPKTSRTRRRQLVSAASLTWVSGQHCANSSSRDTTRSRLGIQITSPNGSELETVAPAGPHGVHEGLMGGLDQVRVSLDEGEGCLTRLFEPEAVMQQIPHV
jgi:hypothetical protein